MLYKELSVKFQTYGKIPRAASISAGGDFSANGTTE